MKNLYVLITASIIIFCSFLNAQWVQTNVPSGGVAYIVTISGTNLFAVTYVLEVGNYIFVSTDNGATWTTAGDFGKLGPSALVGNGINIFAGTWRFGVYLSTNNGTDWTPVNNGLPSDSWITALVFNGENILAGTMSGSVHLSTNNGANWVTLALYVPVPITSFIISETNIFTGTYGAGVFLSTNNGANWLPINNGLTDSSVNSLTVSGTNIFAGTHGSGVYLSTDNGTNWTQVNNGLNNTSIKALAVRGTNIFASTDGEGVYLSTNNGTNWTQVNEGLTNGEVFSLTVGEDNIFAGTGDGVFRRPLSEIISGVDDRSNEILSQYILEQNYPNPFNPSTKIKYSIPTSEIVTIKVFDVIGNEVATLVNEEKSTGSYEMNFDAKGLSSGIYFYKLQTGSFVETKKMILIK